MSNTILRRAVVAAVLTLIARATIHADAAEPPVTTHAGPVPNLSPLAATPFVQLPIGSVRAQGWLLRQLELQKAGLTGSAETLYDALTPDSGWLGGRGEAWEKAPYYVKGLVALAYTLDDGELKTRAQKWIDWAIKSQRPDGFFGPASNDDWWPRMVVLFYLRDYYEATHDPRVLPFLTRYFRHQLTALPDRPLKDWGRSRAGDNIDVVLWTYNRTGEPFLLELASLLGTQAYPWSSIFTDDRFYGFGEDFQPHHIVNVSQALKFPALRWIQTHVDSDRAAYAAGVANLDRQYGRIDGQASGTEMLSGRASTDGVELCADIERILSDGIAVTVLGDAAIGDRLEQIAYNSLPAHTSPRLGQITYYQLPNQIACTFGGHGFAQDYGNGNMPGPHSGFPCCCYNWHTGWPKFVQQMWAATADGGLAAIAYGPNRVRSTVAGGVPIDVTQTTDYPFAETVSLTISPGKAATFPLTFRVPAWCTTPQIAVNGRRIDDVHPGTFHRIQRKWQPGDTVTLKFPMAVRTSKWVNDSVGVERGPLAFALRIKEQWRSVKTYPGGFDEYDIKPASPWNYALDSNGSDITVRTAPVPTVPFSTDAPPVVLTASARRLTAWGQRAAPGTVLLGRVDNGWKQLADLPTLLAPDVPHRLKVEVRGKLIRVYVDDMARPVLDKEDDVIASGGIGLRAYDTEARFDDVKIDGKLVADFTTPSADAWKTFGGAWAVRDGQYVGGTGRDAKTQFVGPDGLRDFTVEATVTLRPGGDAGLLVRASNFTPALDGYRGYYVGLSARAGRSEDAAEPPQSPVTSNEPLETIELIPFGSGKLRVSYLPLLRSK